MISRRTFLSSSACVLGAPFINRGRYRLSAAVPTEYSALTLDVVHGSTVIDMLGLLSLDYRKVLSWFAKPETFQEADYKKLQDSGTTVFHPSVGFVEGDIAAASLRNVRGWDRFLDSHPDWFLRVDKGADLARAKALGKIGIIVGLQNSAHFKTVDDVDRYYRLGQRVSQLTYYDNRLGGGSTDPNDGLTTYGAQVLERMNNLGMAADISHCSDRATLDAINASRKPVLITHSNCRALMPTSHRCKTDEAICKMAERGGVLGITLIRYFVCSRPSVTIEDVLDHIDHVAKIAGIEHAGLGTDVDLDGRDHTPGGRKNDIDGICYERKIFDITEGLVRRNYSRENIEKILGGNFQRALAQILG
ncbi:MAG TPA: membrane dipeptidase [Bryobacteraceae bacterium]|nr:membrane dipeptidase [Bryobacteraceae bacterium]